jgi:DNA-binding FadR family transcriptional regulator
MTKPGTAAAAGPLSYAAPSAPNDRRRLHGSIAHDIAVAIVGGVYPPGSILPNEDQFSQQLAVSRTAYREAIRILSAKGLVESRPKIGTRVSERSKWSLIDPDVLAWHFEIEPSPAYMEQLFELRLMIEPRFAAIAAERHAAADIERIGEALGRMEAATLKSPEGERADLDFHHGIIIATKNEALLALSPGIGATIRWAGRLNMHHPERQPRDPIEEHRAVYEAMADRDSTKAFSIMDRLVRLSLADLRRLAA